MGELGQLLRETREENNVTLEEVESATRIRQKFLAALEEGNYDVLPTPGHVHGFLRNYATHLGLDWNEVQALYTKETSSRRLFEPGIFHPKDIALAPRRPLVKADLVLGLVIALVVLIVGGWAFWQYGWPRVQPMLLALTPAAARTPTPGQDVTPEQGALKPTSTATRNPSPTATHTSVPPTETPVSVTATPTETAAPPTPTVTSTRPLLVATRTPLPTSTPALVPTKTEGVVLQVRVIERAWLQVTVDGQELPGELLEADDERTWEATNTIYFICGNAGGVEVTVNGEELGTLGERAQVVERTWTPEGEVTPTPRATGTPATPTPTPTDTPTPASSP